MFNGIVLVLFSNELRQGCSMCDAVRQGAMLRLRPVLMTASVTIPGVIPTLLSRGVGAQHAAAAGDRGSGWFVYLPCASAPHLYDWGAANRVSSRKLEERDGDSTSGSLCRWENVSGLWAAGR